VVPSKASITQKLEDRHINVPTWPNSNVSVYLLTKDMNTMARLRSDDSEGRPWNDCYPLHKLVPSTSM
jgi:hypothetical protein